MNTKVCAYAVAVVCMVIVPMRLHAQSCSCSEWPTFVCPPFENHSSHDWSCTENWSVPPCSGITITEAQLVWTKNEWNKTEDEVNWNLTDTAATTHSWGVNASVRADLKAGVLTKIIADAKIGVEVGGEYSGSKEKTRQVSISTTIQECRGKGRREYVDYNTPGFLDQ